MANMKFTTSKSEPAAVVAKKGLLRKLGGRVRKIFKREKKVYRTSPTTILVGPRTHHHALYSLPVSRRMKLFPKGH
jgi:hypothetical protein